MTDKLAAALDLAARGFAVFPLAPNTKIPLGGLFGWADRATTDTERIRRCWTEDATRNIGVPTADYLVIDVDPRKGGDTTFAELALIEDFPKTARAVTQGGGAHIVYGLPPGTRVRGGVDKLGQGIDVKSFGGYIVGAGSEIDGRFYRWGNDRPVVVAPQWLIERCKCARRATGASGKRLVPEDEEAIRLAREWLDKHAPTAEMGTIDNTAYRVAARLYDFGVAKDTAVELLAEWSDTHAFPPMALEDIERVASSAERNRENAIGVRHSATSGFAPVEITPRAREIKSENKQNEQRNKDKFASFTAAEGAAMVSEQSGYLVKGLLDRQTTSVVYGPSGEGKTFVCYDLCYHVGAGQPWRGLKVHQGAVLYLATEGGRGAAGRLKALRFRYGDLTDCRFHISPVTADFLHSREDMKGVLAEAQRIREAFDYPIEMIVIDTLSRVLAGGDENSSEHMGVIVKSLDWLRENGHVHIMAVHHTGKQKDRGARGHSLLRAAVDTEIEVDGRVFRVTKQRDMETGFESAFKLVPVRVGIDEDGDELRSCYVEAVEGAGAATEPGPLTTEAAQLKARISEWLTAQCDKDGSTERVFRTGDAIRIFSMISVKNARVHSEQPRAFQMHVSRLLHEMHENAHIGQVSKGKWFFPDAQNAQDAQE